jgi:hypothetical protein
MLNRKVHKSLLIFILVSGCIVLMLFGTMMGT